MERLEPILKQKFWILLGVAIVMTLVGWWMSTAALAAKIATRKSDIDKAFKKVPQGTIPNEDWTKKLSDINSEQERAIARTQSGLWKRQLATMMTWPDGVGLNGGYWGLFTPQSMESIRLSYEDEVQKVWRKLNPLDYTGKGIVSFPLENMYLILRRQPWNRINEVTSEMMWEVKEDLWLMERLFQSIDNVNGGPDVSRNDAAIHVITDLQLRGGGPKAAGGEAGAPIGGGFGAGKLGGDEEDFISKGRMAGGGRAGMPGAPGAAAGPLPPISAEFDPSEEFGEDGSGGSQIGGTQAGNPMGGGGGLGGGRREFMAGTRDSDEVALGGIGGGMASKPLTRYISKEEGKPFKTRGFYLSVTMDHTKIPDLIAELTSSEGSDLPVEVIRVQMARRHEDEISQQANVNRAAPGVRPGMGRFNNNNGDDDERPRGMNRGGAVAPFGGGRPAMGGFPGGAGGFPGGAGGFPPGGAARDFDPAYATAEASLQKSLADPVMAQVTICGIFTLYQKMPEPPEEVAPGVTPAETTPEAATDESNPATTEQPATETEGQPTETASESATAEGETAESDAPMEPGNENPDTAATKPEDVKVEEDK
ncbi:hypothetical protein [Schlesneria paludicola]|uniref:hypothetical protein n=1 Tax=Schlesneria paludicola TaxID=360056 RepID=UPI00029A45DF|nr:hypothetical protein [Schlesneria paludicola]